MKAPLGQLKRLRSLREARAQAELAKARGLLAEAEQHLEHARAAHEDARAQLPKARDSALAELLQGATSAGAAAYVALRYRVADEARADAAKAEQTSAKAAETRRRETEAQAEVWRLKRRDRMKLSALEERLEKPRREAEPDQIL